MDTKSSMFNLEAIEYGIEEDDDMLPEDFKTAYTAEEQAEQVFAALKDWEDYGLGEAEAEYYKQLLMENMMNKTIIWFKSQKKILKV